MKVARVVAPLLLAIGLIGGLFAWSGLSIADVASTLRSLSPPIVVGILASTALFIILSSLKWRLVMGHVASGEVGRPSWSFSLYYTALGSVLALVVTPHAAMVLSRSMGMRMHSKGSAIAGAAASAYEQLFDVVPLLTMSVAALFAIIFKAGFGGWVAIAISLNAAALLAMTIVFRSPFWKLTKFVPLPRRSRDSLSEKLEWFGTPAARTLLGPAFVTKLFAVSLARYVIILLRTAFVMAAVALPISRFQFLEAYGLARLSTLFSITPGELGINEWTWTGVLTWMGCRLDDATRFGITNRLCNIASLFAVCGFLWVVIALFNAATSVDERDGWKLVKKATSAD